MKQYIFLLAIVASMTTAMTVAVETWEDSESSELNYVCNRLAVDDIFDPLLVADIRQQASALEWDAPSQGLAYNIDTRTVSVIDNDESHGCGWQGKLMEDEIYVYYTYSE